VRRRTAARTRRVKDGGSGFGTSLFEGNRREERFRRARQRGSHAERSSGEDLRRDPHDQLGLILARRLALEQQAENRDVPMPGIFCRSSLIVLLISRRSRTSVRPAVSTSVSPERAQRGIRKPGAGRRCGVEREDDRTQLQVKPIA